MAYNAPHYPLQAPEQDVRKYDGRYDKGWDQLRRERIDRMIGARPEGLQDAVAE